MKTISLGFAPEVAKVDEGFFYVATHQSMYQSQHVAEAIPIAREWNYGR
jgi:hypothetical protein